MSQCRKVIFNKFFLAHDTYEVGRIPTTVGMNSIRLHIVISLEIVTIRKSPLSILPTYLKYFLLCILVLVYICFYLNSDW